MDKQNYHQPEFRVYGNIKVMTQSMTTGSITDNAQGGGNGQKKS